MCRLTKIRSSDGRVCKVAEIKKDCILNVIKHASICDDIDKIVVFGSAIDRRCTDDSDIDLAVFGAKSKNKMMTSKTYRAFTSKIYSFHLPQDYDVLYFVTGKEGDHPILEEIHRGQVIYRRAVVLP